MRRVRLAGVLAFAVLLALAGCARAPSSGAGSAPRASASASPPGDPGARPGVTPIVYPGNARAYAEAALAAWRDDDIPQLTGLLTPDAHNQLAGIPGPPAQDWTYQRCEAAGDSTYCEFRNGSGETVGLRLANAQLGKAHGVSEIRFTPA